MTHAKSRPVALRMIVGAAAVMAALLAFVPAASAARDPISGGTTDLHLKKGFLKKLTNLGVGLAGLHGHEPGLQVCQQFLALLEEGRLDLFERIQGGGPTRPPGGWRRPAWPG